MFDNIEVLTMAEVGEELKLPEQVLEDIVNTCSSKYWGLMERSNSFEDNGTVFSDCLFRRLLVIKVMNSCANVLQRSDFKK